MFYNKEIKVYELQPFENEWGVTVEDQYVLIKALMVDIQPYSQEKLKKEYGYDLQSTKRMFCDLDIDITESSLITYRGKPFNVVKIIEWDDYLDISLDDAVGVDLNER